MDKRVELLKELAGGERDTLTPSPNLQSHCGYRYPEAQAALSTEPGGEIEHLDTLATLGYLERAFFDKIHLCPACNHFPLNFREVCSRCQSANIDLVEMLHHFRCGYVAPEVEFRDGIRYLCPKCNQPLRHIGVDYERPTSNYLCASCEHLFAEAQVSCLCLKCGESFGVEKAVLRAIYRYRLTAKGALAAARGEIETSGVAGQILEADLGLYALRFFEEHLAQELRLAKRYKRPLSILLVSPDHLDAYEARNGKEATGALLKSLGRILKEVLRDSDVPALYRATILAGLLPDTPIEGAQIVAGKITQKVSGLSSPEQEPPITVSTGLASITDGVGSAEQLMALAEARLDEATRAGGNRVLPPRA